MAIYFCLVLGHCAVAKRSAKQVPATEVLAHNILGTAHFKAHPH